MEAARVATIDIDEVEHVLWLHCGTLHLYVRDERGALHGGPLQSAHDKKDITELRASSNGVNAEYDKKLCPNVSSDPVLQLLMDEIATWLACGRVMRPRYTVLWSEFSSDVGTVVLPESKRRARYFNFRQAVDKVTNGDFKQCDM